MRCAILLVALAACDAGARPPAGPRIDELASAELRDARTRAQRELDAVARAALERYAADPTTVPDHGLLEEEKIIFVDRDLTRDEGGVLTGAALPSGTFELRSSGSMQEDADRANTYVHYIFIRNIEIEGDRATFWIGVHLKIPERPEGPGTCCCSAEQVYVKRGGTWVYVETTSSICS